MPAPSPQSGPQDLSIVVLGVPVSTLSMDATVQAIVTWACQPTPSEGPRYVCATSVHGLIEATEHPEFRRVLLDADIVAPDGMPLVWLGKIRGRRAMERVYGPDLMKSVCRASTRLGLRHYFYGGDNGVAGELASRLASWYPGLVIAGTCSPPFRSLTISELEAVAARIDASEADLVWVGLSTPKQERWIAAVRPLLRRVKVLLSVGAAFDFHTGRKPQAPVWMRSSGLEWLFRLSQEPRRLWRRYAYNNPRFVWLAALELLRWHDFRDR